jgi:hypothetical protein
VLLLMLLVLVLVLVVLLVVLLVVVLAVLLAAVVVVLLVLVVVLVAVGSRLNCLLDRYRWFHRYWFWCLYWNIAKVRFSGVLCSCPWDRMGDNVGGREWYRY